MKNATKHADELKSLCKRLVKEHKPADKQPLDPLPALVRGAMSYDVADAKADEAMRVIEREFVDLNELRVATDLEIQDLLGFKYPQIERRVLMITAGLNYIFEKLHTLNLDKLKEMPKKEARAFLRELPDVHPFVEAYVALFALDAPAFPIDDDLLARLTEAGAVESGSSLADAQRFVEHQVKAEDLYEFFAAARAAASKRKQKAKA